MHDGDRVYCTKHFLSEVAFGMIKKAEAERDAAREKMKLLRDVAAELWGQRDLWDESPTRFLAWVHNQTGEEAVRGMKAEAERDYARGKVEEQGKRLAIYKFDFGELCVDEDAVRKERDTLRARVEELTNAADRLMLVLQHVDNQDRDELNAMDSGADEFRAIVWPKPPADTGEEG